MELLPGHTARGSLGSHHSCSSVLNHLREKVLAGPSAQLGATSRLCMTFLSLCHL